MHLYLSSTNPKSLEDARMLAENLLDTISAECGASRLVSATCYFVYPTYLLGKRGEQVLVSAFVLLLVNLEPSGGEVLHFLNLYVSSA